MKTGFSQKQDIDSRLRTLLIFLLVLVLLASAVLSVRLSGWNGRGERISLSGGGSNTILRVFNASQGLRTLRAGLSDENFNIHDDTVVWQTETHVDIFRRSYISENGLTVNTSDGDKLIAPGTEGRYRFTIENTGKLPMYYELTFESWQNGFRFDLPMQARVYSERGDYLLGSGTEWPDIRELNNALDQQTLDAGKSLSYTLEWRWPYEQPAGDWLDTAFGDQATYTDVELGVRIMTNAEIDEEVPVTPSPTPEVLVEVETPLADTGRAWALVNLICTILSCLIGIYELVIWLRGRKEDDDAKDKGIYETEDYEKRRKRRKKKIWDLIPAIGAVIAFILTEDMRLPMVWVDRWTILMVIILIISVLIGCFTRLKKVEEEDEEEAPPSAT